jgi:LysR family transcriptional activator of nhaA
VRADVLRRLNFRHLHYFWVVAREEHLTRAAERLHVSQSAVSAQLRQLEASLGHELFVREGRGLRLTEVGSHVLAYADSIFNLGTELLESLASGEGALQPVLRVGAAATLSRNFQQNLLRPLIGDESLRLVLESASLEELLHRLQVHKLDLVLSNRPVGGDERAALQCRRIARQSVCLVGPRRRRGFRFPQHVKDRALLLPGPSSEIRRQIDLLWQELGLTLQVSAEVDDMALLRLLARDSGSLAIVPEVVVQDELRAGILHKHCELPGIREDFFAITVSRHFPLPALRRIIEPS